jgi:hypothetical protein
MRSPLARAVAATSCRLFAGDVGATASPPKQTLVGLLAASPSPLTAEMLWESAQARH